MASMGNAQRGALGGLAKLGEGPRTTSDLSRVGGGLSRGANEGKKLNAAPWSDTFPAAGATLDLDFANNRGFVRGVGQGGVMDAITFTRASNGTFVKPDGTLSTHANQGALGNNLLSFPQDFDNSYWVKNAPIIVANTTIAPDGTLTADSMFEQSGSGNRVLSTTNFTALANTSYTFSFYVKKLNGRDFVQLIFGAGGWETNQYANFDLANGVVSFTGAGLTSANISLENNDWYRISITATSKLSPSSGNISIAGITQSDSIRAQNYLGNIDFGYFIWGAQLELGSTATEYFPTNIGEPRFDWASTDSTGAGTIADPRIIPLRANPTSNGILIEEARTNRLLWNRDATQTQWVKTNITAAKDQTGIDGVANAASSLTATDDNGTCIQTITLAAGNRTGSVYLKRLTGTGLIQVTLDGSTYSTVELSDTEWYRIVLSGSVTNPTVGIKIVVDGDAVAMDYGQVEDGLYASTPILTTTATVTRAVDLSEITDENFNNFYNQFGGTFFLEGEVRGRGLGNGFSVALRLGTTNTVRIFGRGSGTTEYVRPTIGSSDFFGSFGLTSEEYKFKEIFSYKNGYASVAINGNRNGLTAREELTNAIMPTVDRLRIFGTQPYTLKYIKYTPQVLPAVAVKEFST
jgi:hypothetical protein